MSYSSQTTNGVTVINDNGKITVNGKAIDAVETPITTSLLNIFYCGIIFAGGFGSAFLYFTYNGMLI